MRSFSQLLQLYAERTGISDAELARAVGVRRQTIFRWKEGTVGRPRSRDDVLALSQKLRLSPSESDELLIAAGFYAEGELALSTESDVIGAKPAAQLPQNALLPDAPPAPDSGPDSRQIHPPTTGVGRAKFNRFGLGLSAFLLVALLVGLWWARSVPLPVAAPGETLVVVGQFTNFTGGEIGFNVAGRIADPLRQEIEGAGLAGVRVAVWPHMSAFSLVEFFAGLFVFVQTAAGKDK